MTSTLPASAYKRLSHLASILGPGLLMAGAAVGVSHLIQSTRSGADFGMQLLWVIILVNLMKYPFFRIGHRYAVACGETLLDGYLRMGKAWLWCFLIVNFFAAFISLAGVTIVTAGLAENLFRFGWGLDKWSSLILIGCALLVTIGQYRWLDYAIRVQMALLVVATFICFIAAIWHGSVAPAEFISPSPWTIATLPFVIALMGWMPAPIELSVWQSLWIRAREKDRNEKTTHYEALLDFNHGYAITVFTAIMFLTLGALVMHGSGETFSDNGAVFGSQLVEIYTRFMGSWARPVIATAALMAMLSTTLTVVDAYPRSLQVGLQLALPRTPGSAKIQHVAWIICIGLLGLWVILFFKSDLRNLIDFATTLAFLFAPFFAFINYRLIRAHWIPPSVQPGPAFRIWCYIGWSFFAIFSLAYIYIRFLA